MTPTPLQVFVKISAPAPLVFSKFIQTPAEIHSYTSDSIHHCCSCTAAEQKLSCWGVFIICSDERRPTNNILIPRTCEKRYLRPAILVLDGWAQGKDSRAQLQLTHRQGPSIYKETSASATGAIKRREAPFATQHSCNSKESTKASKWNWSWTSVFSATSIDRFRETVLQVTFLLYLC